MIWKERWENKKERDCWKCKKYWGDGAGCDALDCCQRPDLCTGNHFEKKESED